jgi:transposase
MANTRVRGRPIAQLVLSAQERAYLERQVRRHRIARSLSERCRVILRCADGLASKDVAAELGLHEHTVGKWRRRFLKDRCEGLFDEARPGRPRSIDDDQVAAVIERTSRTTPLDATHWSIRSMAAEAIFYEHYWPVQEASTCRFWPPIFSLARTSALGPMSETLAPIFKRRDFLCSHPPHCPECNSDQVRIRRFDAPALWRCQMCEHWFEHEPDDHEQTMDLRKRKNSGAVGQQGITGLRMVQPNGPSKRGLGG